MAVLFVCTGKASKRLKNVLALKLFLLTNILKLYIILKNHLLSNAYSDVVAQNRMKIPNEIEINVDTFNDKTTDGQNETDLIEKFNTLVRSVYKELHADRETGC